MSAIIREYSPSASLTTFINSYWTGSFNIHGVRDFTQSVVPNGFIELIIHHTDDHCYLTKNECCWDSSPEFTLIGLYKKPYEVMFSRVVDVFGIRFYPEGIFHILGVPPADFMATYEDSTEVFGQEFKDYCARLREMESIPEKIAYTNAFLQGRLKANKKDFDYVRYAAFIIRQRNGLISQKELLEQIYLSPRQLQRAFKQQLGMTAKEYMRLARLNAVQKYLQGSKEISFSDAAYDHGFADQSHFIREFKSFTGKSPKVFMENRDHFIVNIDREEN